MSSGVQARLLEREEARKAEVARRREEREGGRREEETAAYFTHQLAAKKAAIEELIAAAETTPPSQLSAHFEQILLECHALQKFVSDSSLFLTSYDLRNSQQQVSQLLSDVSLKQDALMPKKKFAFSSRKKPSTQPPLQGAPVPVQAGDSQGGGTVASKNESYVGFRQREKEKLAMRDTEVKGHDINLSHLNGCEVRLFGCPSTLHMSHLTNCLVLCGPVCSSVFIEDCKNCTLVVACQQLRVHTTVGSTIYLHVTSRAVIEDCSELQFAPYNLSYPQLMDHFKEAGLDWERNNWDKVDDFNWLASRDPSPNWKILSDRNRTTQWT